MYYKLIILFTVQISLKNAIDFLSIQTDTKHTIRVVKNIPTAQPVVLGRL